MKKAVNLLLIAVFVSLFNGLVLAEENTEGLELWFNGGYQTGDVSFRESGPGSWISDLEFDTDGYHFVGAGARYQFLHSAWPRLSLCVEGFSARSLDGSVNDTDYLVSSPYPYINSKSEIEGTNNVFDVNAGWQILKSKEGAVQVDLLFGYYTNEYDFDIDNVFTTVYNYTTTYDIVVGHASKYQTEFKGEYFGVAGLLSFFEDKLRVNASLKYLPNIKGTGTADWELRALRFEQDGKGDGVIFTIGATVIPKNNWSIGLNLIRTEMDVDGKTDNYALSHAEDEYGLSTYGIQRDWSSQNDLNYIQIDNLRTELRIGYVF